MESMAQEHHHEKTETHERYLWIALILTAIFTVVEVLGAWISGSLALFSDAVHMFTDVTSLVIALAAVKIGQRVADKKRTFGYYRFEILAAVLNAVILLIVSAYIFYEGYKRLTSPSEVEPTMMLVVASLGLIVNLIGIRLLHAGSKENLNVRGAYLEAWADMMGSLGVILAGVIIYFTQWERVDSVIAILIGLWVLPRSWALLKASINILLEGVPEGIELAEIYDNLMKIPGVKDVHDLHVWALTSKKISLTVHLVIDPDIQSEQKVLQQANQLIEHQFKVLHSTVQIELEPCERQPEFHVY